MSRVFGGNGEGGDDRLETNGRGDTLLGGNGDDLLLSTEAAAPSRSAE